MGFDWRALERRENERTEKGTLLLALGWVVLGVVGPLVRFALTGAHDLVGDIIWISVGLGFLTPAALARRRKMKAGSGSRPSDP